MFFLFTAVAFVLFVLLNVGVFALVVKAMAQHRRKVDESMHWLADTLELTRVGGEPKFPNSRFLSCIRTPLRVDGRRRGCDLSIYHYTTGGRNSTDHAAIRVELDNPKGLRLGFSRESVLGKVGKALGMQDVQLGDERFDGLFVVKCSDPDFIKGALLPEVKERFYEVWEKYGALGSIKLDGNALVYDETGKIHNDKARERFVAVTELMCDLGGVVQFYNQAQ
jgi:hypothetical protein